METKEILKQLRESRGYSIQDVSEMTEISYSVYQKYESGARGVGVPALSKLADFYGVTTDYLLGREPAPDDPIVSLCNALNISQEEKQFISNYFNMPSEMRLNAIRFLSKLTSND